MATWIISGVLGFVSGGAVIWFFKDPLIKWWKGAEAFARSLKEKADKIKSAL